MSNVSESSSGTSCNGPRGKGRVVGVPKLCWCGSSICALISKSKPNPYRRFFRCSYAANQRLENDEHIFKWVDEAHLNEIEALQFKYEKLEKDLNDMKAEREGFEKMVFDKVQMRTEKEISDKDKVELVESSNNKKKTIILVVIGCVVMYGFGKLVR